jgi:hypothetical protein
MSVFLRDYSEKEKVVNCSEFLSASGTFRNYVSLRRNYREFSGLGTSDECSC